jgi:hypothetical protein
MPLLPLFSDAIHRPSQFYAHTHAKIRQRKKKGGYPICTSLHTYSGEEQTGVKKQNKSNNKNKSLIAQRRTF